MTEPQAMINWLDRRISSALTWLEDHGRHSKRPRPDHDIETKEEDVRMFEEIKVAYEKALAKREAAE